MASAMLRQLELVDDEEKVNAVLKAVEKFDLTSSPAWEELDSLSTHTEFDEMDARPDGIFSRLDGTIEIVATAYIKLVYGGKSDSTSLADSYPAKVVGHFDRSDFIIDNVTVDTSSFFE